MKLLGSTEHAGTAFNSPQPNYLKVLIVIGPLGLMAIGVPPGIATLSVSLVAAVLYFGEPAGFFIVAANVSEVLHEYGLIAVPFFVFMANVLDRFGIAKSLFDSLTITGGRFRGSVGVQPCVVAVLARRHVRHHGREDRHAGAHRTAANATAGK